VKHVSLKIGKRRNLNASPCAGLTPIRTRPLCGLRLRSPDLYTFCGSIVSGSLRFHTLWTRWWTRLARHPCCLTSVTAQLTPNLDLRMGISVTPSKLSYSTSFYGGHANLLQMIFNAFDSSVGWLIFYFIPKPSPIARNKRVVVYPWWSCKLFKTTL
jgi:hypothetical protein